MRSIRSFSLEFKRQVVEELLSGEGSRSPFEFAGKLAVFFTCMTHISFLSYCSHRVPQVKLSNTRMQ